MQAIPKPKRIRSRQPVGWSATAYHNRRWRHSVALGALDQLCAGVIIADSGGRVIEMNRAAESIVRLDDGLNVRSDRLCARRAFETAKIAKLIAGAAADAKSDRAAGRMLVGRGNGLTPYVLTVAPLHIDRRCRPGTTLPFGQGSGGILWIVAGRGAACGSAAHWKNAF